MGDVPGLGLSFPPFAAPRWFCPESDDDDEEQQQCFIPAYGRPPFGLYGPYGDPLLVPPRGFTDADSDTRGLSAAWGHRVTAEVSARPALPAPGRPTAAFGPSAPTRRSRGPGSVLPVRREPPPCFCPPAEPRRDPSRVRGSRRRPHRHPSTAAVWVSQPSPALQRGPGAHSRSAAPLVPQEAEKNAMELLAEEERMKRKAEKKKLKKKVGLCCCGAQHSWASAPPPELCPLFIFCLRLIRRWAVPQGVCWACAAAASSPSSPSPRFWFPEAEGPEETGEVGTGAEEQTGGRVGEQLSTSLGRAAPGTALGSSLFEVPQRAPTNPRTPGAAGSGAHPLPFSVCRAPHPCLALWVLLMGTPAVLRRRVAAWPPAPPRVSRVMQRREWGIWRE